MNKKIYLMTFLCAVFLCLVSCELDDVKSQQIMNGYFTITGSSPNYKLIADNGTIVYPTSSSVSDITKGFGFGNHKRVYFNIYYNKENMTTENETITIRNAELQKVTYLIEMKTICEEEATKAGIMQEDSIFPINTLGNCWLSNGYLTSLFAASYSIINDIIVESDANLCATNISDNAVTFKMLYNRHTKKNDTNVKSNKENYAYSFDISKLNIPGNDSVTVTFETLGAKTSSCKVARNVFKYAQ